MNLEPLKTDPKTSLDSASEIRAFSGTARALAGVTILTLATIAILVVLDIIPRDVFSALASKVAMVAGICVVAAVAIGFLSRR